MTGVAIDIECDGIKSKWNQIIFPSGCHMDPESRMWCISFTYGVPSGISTQTLACKLPPTTRPLPFIGSDGRQWFTKSYHEESTVIPATSAIVDNNYESYLGKVEKCISHFANKNVPIFFRGYYDGKQHYDYDKLMLDNIFTQHNIPTSALSGCYNLNRYYNYKWEETSKQNKVWGCPNQQFLEMGLKHNKEDSEQLYKHVKEFLNDKQ